MQLHLFRHGQTDWNAARRVQGQSESQLSTLGIEQAQSLGARVRDLPFDRIFCSSSLRTRQTAAHVFGAARNDVQYLDSLREINLGPWEGKLYADLEVEQATAFRHFWEEPHLFQVEGAETFLQLQQRALTAVNGIVNEVKQGQVAIVSHGALIKSLMCYFEQRPLSELWAPPLMHNCAHSIIEVNDDGSGHILQYADQSIQGSST